jgi:hypothetical protein
MSHHHRKVKYPKSIAGHTSSYIITNDIEGSDDFLTIWRCCICGSEGCLYTYDLEDGTTVDACAKHRLDVMLGVTPSS